MTNQDDATVVGEGRPVANKPAKEATEAMTMHSRIEEAKTLMRKALSTPFVFDKTRDDLVRQAFDLLSNIATE